VTNHLCALRFFYIQTLKKPWSIADTPYPKKAHRLPTILSQEEVARLIDAALTPFHHTLLMTLYGSGVRNAELTHLKVADIDSQRMVIHALSIAAPSPCQEVCDGHRLCVLCGLKRSTQRFQHTVLEFASVAAQ
jgi:hypothetical protein